LRNIEKKAQRKESKEQVGAKMAALEKEKEAITANMSQFERKIKKLEDEMTELSILEASLQTKGSAASREAGDEVPRTKHLLSLYRSISNIQWRQDSAFIEGRTFSHFLSSTRKHQRNERLIFFSSFSFFSFIVASIQMSRLQTTCDHSCLTRPSFPRSLWPTSSGI
jgi:predicted RNase H-like nuclease (RuvC/YqgF family)